MAEADQNGEKGVLKRIFGRAADYWSAVLDELVRDDPMSFGGDPIHLRREPLEEDAEDGTSKKKPDPAVTPEEAAAIRKKYGLTPVGRAINAYFGIFDKGDYTTVWGRQRDQNNPGIYTLSDRQLRRALIHEILVNGSDKIYFYRGNKIDTQLAMRARAMVTMELSKTIALAGKDPGSMISFTHMLTTPPFRRLGVISDVFHRAAVVWEQWKMDHITIAGRARRENRMMAGIAPQPEP